MQDWFAWSCCVVFWLHSVWHCTPPSHTLWWWAKKPISTKLFEIWISLSRILVECFYQEFVNFRMPRLYLRSPPEQKARRRNRILSQLGINRMANKPRWREHFQENIVLASGLLCLQCRGLDSVCVWGGEQCIVMGLGQRVVCKGLDRV